MSNYTIQTVKHRSDLKILTLSHNSICMNPGHKSTIIGILLTAGCAIGGGMFSLPIVSSGMWFPFAVLSFFVVWLISYLSSLMILEVNLEYPVGSSFDTFVKDILGSGWNILFGVLIAFMLYILLYAYCSAFGNIAVHLFQIDTESSPWLQGTLGFFLAMIFATVVWVSTSFTGRMTSILVIAMAISFVVATSGTYKNISITSLFAAAPEGDSYAKYIWVGLPYFITSFGFASIVPSLYKYFGKDVYKIKSSLFWGSLIALGTYIFWLVITLGVLPREEFEVINAAGGNVGDLVKAIETKIDQSSIQAALNFFTNFAIISSFLGVGLSLFDYVADRFSLENNVKGRCIAMCLTFLPPAIASFFMPHGFIKAIGYAGFVLYLAFFLIPFLMLWKFRQTAKGATYSLSGGKLILIMVLLLSSVTAICKILAMFKLLPSF